MEEHAQGLTAGNRCSWGLNPALSASPLCTLFTLHYPVLPLMCYKPLFPLVENGKKYTTSQDNDENSLKYCTHECFINLQVIQKC